MEFPGHNSYKAEIVLAAVLLLFPSSAQVLCIAPGQHLADEDINAHCSSASSDVSAPVMPYPFDGFNPADNSGHCTDIFLTPYGRGAVLESSDSAAADSAADGCPWNALPDYDFSPLWQPGERDKIGPVSLSLPVTLRC